MTAPRPLPSPPRPLDPRGPLAGGEGAPTPAAHGAVSPRQVARPRALKGVDPGRRWDSPSPLLGGACPAAARCAPPPPLFGLGFTRASLHPSPGRAALGLCLYLTKTVSPRAARAGGEMADAQDGGAPRDPARVAQFGRAGGGARRAGAPSSPFPSPSPPTPGPLLPPPRLRFTGARRAGPPPGLSQASLLHL